MATDKNGHGAVPDPVQIRSRTGAGENQNY